MRPNQVIAISLTYPVLDPSRWKPVMDVVERELLTPYGLRTLSPNDPRYQGIYEGDLETPGTTPITRERSGPGSWGPSSRPTSGPTADRTRPWPSAPRLLEGFEEHLSEAGLGQISEIFDGDPPHKPRGCIAQAWSVAELLRVIAEDLAPRPAPALGRAQGQPR